MRRRIRFPTHPSQHRLAVTIPALALAASAAPAAAQTGDDPFLWLEEVEGERALEWAETRSQATLNELAAHPLFEPIQSQILEILDSDDRIPSPSIMGERIYNFWQDAEHPRGIWRRSDMQSYVAGTPEWETVLDIDALSADEGVNWSFGGATCLRPDYRRCLVRLSRGGADAVEVREFDTEVRAFIDAGFFLPEAKLSLDWVDENSILVATDFGEGSLTTSGYARVAKLWERGTSLDAARTLFEGETEDVAVNVGTYETADRTWPVVIHRPEFFDAITHVLLDGELVRLDLPVDATPTIMGDRMVVRLRSDWEIGGQTHRSGALISIGFEDFIAGEREFQIVYEPDSVSSVQGVGATRSHLLVNLLRNVQTELRRYFYQDGRWSYEVVPAPELETASFSATSPDTDRYFFTSSGYTRPTTLYLAEEDGSLQEVQRLPEMFDASDLVVEQHQAISADGTRVPYFLVHRDGMQNDGTNPTLLYAYGGFEVSLTPGYDATVGATWLERGGVYAVANLRGGGEFGPEWHRAAMRENRQRAYDDFLAVAQDLIDREITSPPHLGISGGSNGGLLVGAAVTQRPDLFGAVVSAVPLLDMRRYHLLLAGASWMAEYGDPDDPEDWAFIREYSPYQNVRADVRYPRILFTTTTRDDRVHPGHARKMAALMQSLDHPIYYFENTEGGHGSGVTNEQRAAMSAVQWTYLWKMLAGDDPPSP